MPDFRLKIIKSFNIHHRRLKEIDVILDGLSEQDEIYMIDQFIKYMYDFEQIEFEFIREYGLGEGAKPIIDIIFSRAKKKLFELMVKYDSIKNICTNCIHYEDEVCLKFSKKPPIEFALNKNTCKKFQLDKTKLED